MRWSLHRALLRSRLYADFVAPHTVPGVGNACLSAPNGHPSEIKGKSGMNLKIVALAFATVLLAACSSVATITSTKPDTTIVVADRTMHLPNSINLRGTSFGNYAFKAVDTAEPSAEPLYGILPLAMKKGQMAASILFFAPALFFNLRGAFRFYEVDISNNAIRYRDRERDPWMTYQIKPEEASRARARYERWQQAISSPSPSP